MSTLKAGKQKAIVGGH